jgi:hypothetical protein
MQSKVSPVEWLIAEITMQYPEINIRQRQWMIDKALKMEQDKKEEIRTAFSEYYKSEGCSCCSDPKNHLIAEKKLAELLDAEPYIDESGFNWYQYAKKND